MDDQLRGLVTASQGVPDPLTDPPEASVQFLDDLHLSDQDLDLLLGADAAGFRSLADLRADGRLLFKSIRSRVAKKVCVDDELRDSVASAFEGGVDVLWVTLVGVVGLTPASLVAIALKPLASALAVRGAGALCRGNVTRPEP